MHSRAWATAWMQRWGSPGVRSRTTFVNTCVRDLKTDAWEVAQAAQGFCLSHQLGDQRRQHVPFKRDSATPSLATLAWVWPDTKNFYVFQEFSEAKKGKSRDARYPSPHKMKLSKDMTVFQIFLISKNTKMLPNTSPWA